MPTTEVRLHRVFIQSENLPAAGSGLAQYRKDDPIDENGNLITAGTAGAVEAEPLEEPEEEGFFAEEEPEVEAAADTQEDSGTLV